MTEIVKQSTARDAASRAARIREGIHGYLATLADIAAAYAEGDHLVLGYDSWQSYVDGEFGAERLRLPVEHRQKAVAELRLAGMSQRAIGTVLGVAQDTVSRDLAQLNDSVQLPDRVMGRDRREKPAARPNPPPEVASVAAALDRHVPDPDGPHRAFRSAYLSYLVAGRKPLLPTVEQMVEHADEQCVEELGRLAADVATYHERVARARLAAYGENVVPMKRSAL